MERARIHTHTGPQTLARQWKIFIVNKYSEANFSLSSERKSTFGAVKAISVVRNIRICICCQQQWLISGNSCDIPGESNARANLKVWKSVFSYKIHTFHAYGDLSTQCSTRASNKVAQSKGKAKAKEKSITNFRSKMTDETNFCKEIDNNKNKNSVRCKFCSSIILKPNSANYSDNEVNVLCVRAYVYDTALVIPTPNFHTGTSSMWLLLFFHSFES